MNLSDNWVRAGLFFLCFGLYGYSASPHLPPYRDAGEMVSVISLLGVAHPPGYPLYTLLARWALLIPFGTEAYRINLFSGWAAALAVTVFYSLFRISFGRMASALACLFLAVSRPFWELAAVPEMYTLGALALGLLLYSALALENENLTAFFLGISLGARMDLLLFLPLFLFWFYRRKGAAVFPRMILFLGLGATLFLYLPIRSLQDPWLDWGNPDTLGGLLNSLRRKSYGGTLDLLSLSYKTGANFLVNMKLYGRHLWSSFGPWGVGLVGWGAFLCLKGRADGSRPKGSGFVGAAFVIAGPFFIFLANMPPNPHAAAIIEASYLVPDILLVFFIAAGAQRLKEGRWGHLASAAMTLLIFVNTFQGYPAASKRDNWHARDYVENVFRSAPFRSVAVFHEDVQLFSLWEALVVGNRRPDLSFLSTGLSSSDWYWDMINRWRRPAMAGGPASPTGGPAVAVVSLKEPAGWTTLQGAIQPRLLVAGYETDVPNSSQLEIFPRGLVVEVVRAGSLHPADIFSLPGLCIFRNMTPATLAPDFFSSDLIVDVARAAHQVGYHEMIREVELGRADWFFRWAAFLDPDFPRAVSDRGFLYLKHGRFAEGLEAYQRALRVYENLLEKAREYRTLPPVVNGLKSDMASAATHAGVCAERMGNRELARLYYDQALGIFENAAAHYNSAVLDWDRDWEAVIRHLTRAVELEPARGDLRATLMKALQLSGRDRGK